MNLMEDSSKQLLRIDMQGISVRNRSACSTIPMFELMQWLPKALLKLQGERG